MLGLLERMSSFDDRVVAAEVRQGPAAQRIRAETIVSGRRPGETDMRVKRIRDRASLHLLAGSLATIALSTGCGQKY